ncbi:NADH dehydrogenase [ubiquinone] 1 alpha subcomplex subunit 2 [Ctenocephalides felis]|uniref:NADH dehydrogenase [ubiquinone] 1 alpha subcomplex subunit 2 n=1 Tax=Ctenocephalides felis TaxID=7515 RepID=UPI000E6E49CE|nr:NADH dehydrogenase [ubiquinone] 1 alpha subcomplex subunit 2 [Ctenocephalides felis]
MASRAVKFGPHLKELRIHLCQTHETSQGVRDFMNKFYVSLKGANPNFPILVRECSGVQPRVFARYEKGKEVSVPLTNQSGESVMEQIQKLAAKC